MDVHTFNVDLFERFDRINHTSLFKKLQQFEFSGPLPSRFHVLFIIVILYVIVKH